MKDTKGITLIALIITIIVLVILAGITINQLVENGILEKAKETKYRAEEAQKNEIVALGEYENTINQYLDGTRENNKWKFLKTVIGTERIDISNINCEELYIEVRIASNAITLTFNIPYIALEENARNYRTGYAERTDNMMNVEINASKNYIELYWVKEQNGTNTANTSISVYYK